MSLDRTPSQIRERQQACLRLVDDRRTWEAVLDIANAMRETALEQCLQDETRPRAFYQGTVGAVEALIQAIQGEADRARTEGDPEAKAEDETELVADVLAGFRSGGGRLA